MKLSHMNKSTHLKKESSAGEVKKNLKKSSENLKSLALKKTKMARPTQGIEIKKSVKLIQPPSYFGSVSGALFQRMASAGSWVQQGFERVFSLTLFSPSEIKWTDPKEKGNKVEKSTLSKKKKMKMIPKNEHKHFEKILSKQRDKKITQEKEKNLKEKNFYKFMGKKI